MKLNCGLSEKTKNELETKRLADKARAIIKGAGKWTKHFCWWPVRIGDNDCRWLEYVERLYEVDVKYIEAVVCGFSDELIVARCCWDSWRDNLITMEYFKQLKSDLTHPTYTYRPLERTT